MSGRIQPHKNTHATQKSTSATTLIPICPATPISAPPSLRQLHFVPWSRRSSSPSYRQETQRSHGRPPAGLLHALVCPRSHLLACPRPLCILPKPLACRHETIVQTLIILCASDDEYRSVFLGDSGQCQFYLDPAVRAVAVGNHQPHCRNPVVSFHHDITGRFLAQGCTNAQVELDRLCLKQVVSTMFESIKKQKVRE